MIKNPTESRLFEIDLLRGFAILLVLFRHTHYCLPTFITKYPMVLQGTWSGVDLFFVISGFVISLTLIPQVEKYFTGETSLKKLIFSFFRRRIFRLLPLSMTALALNLLLAGFFNHSGQFGKWLEIRNEILPVIFNFYNYYIWSGGSSNMSWYWSLAIEEQFYAVFPFFLILVRPANARKFAYVLAFALITFLIRPFFTPSFASVDFKLWPMFTTPSHLRFDCIIAGCLAGILFRETKMSSIVFGRALSVAALIGVAVCGAVLPRFELTGYPAIAICSFILVWLAALNKGYVPALGMPKFMNWLGRRSYGVYLFHMIVIHFQNEIVFRVLGKTKNDLSWTQGFVNLFLAYGLTFVLSEYMYRTIEKRGIAYGHAS